MQNVINSNIKSNVLATLTSGDVQSLSYAVPPTYPNVSKSNTLVSPYLGFVGSPHSQSHTFKIPRSNYNYLGQLKFSYTRIFEDAPDLAAFNIINLIQNIQWLSNGQPILTTSGEALRAMTMNSPGSVQNYVQRYSRALVPGSETASAFVNDETPVVAVSYCPLYASWYKRIEQAFNTSELEQLEIVVTYKSASAAGLRAGEDFTAFKAEFECLKYMPDQATLNKMVVADYASPANFETFNTFTERFPMAWNSTGITVESSANQAIYKTHVFIAQTNAAVVSGCPLTPITGVSLNIGGEVVLNNYSSSMVNLEQAFRGMGATSLSGNNITYNTQAQCITIDWSLGGHRDYNTGLASFANLNKPEFTVTTAAALGANTQNFALFLVHEYWNILNYDPSSRYLSVYASV